MKALIVRRLNDGGQSINMKSNDSRFDSLEEEELDEIQIEVSVLTKPFQLKFDCWEDLLEKIDDRMGIILSCNGQSATFLPSVWEQIPDKEIFLEELSMKAGLDKDSWKDENCKIEIYSVEKIIEEE